jgi:hypothetical protein
MKKSQKFLPLLLALACSLAPLGASAATKQKLYRWVDENGVVHVGDTIPAEYADQDKDILNDKGVTVGQLEGRVTDEELAEAARQEQLRASAERARRADKALLATYLSIDEIEAHRNRRIELLEAQARVSELYLKNLRRRMVKLQDEAANYKPYSANPDAELIAPDLAEDMSETKDRVIRYESRLANARRELDAVREEFEFVITRYAELTGVNR